VVLKDSVNQLTDLSDAEASYELQQLQSLLEFFEAGVSVYEDLESQKPNNILETAGNGAAH
jgi:hypothetical protein